MRVVALILMACLALVASTRLAAAQQNILLVPLEATINQNAVMRQDLSPPPTRQRSLRGRLEEPIAGVPPGRLAETKFRLRAVDFEPPPGIPVDPAAFPPAWASLIGKTISLKDLGTVLVTIEDIYRQHDYVVIAKAPPQDFSSGRIRIVAYAVHVTEVDIKDDRLRGRLDSVVERIKSLRPLRLSGIYRQLLIAEDLVNGEIQADWFQIEGDPGAARLELSFSTQRARLSLNFDNFGASGIGPLQAGANARLNDILGLFESTDIKVLTNPSNPQLISVLGFGQTVPIGTDGFSVSYGLARSWSNPNGAAEQIGLHSEVTIANAGVNYSLLRTMERNVIVSAAFNENDSSTDLRGRPLTRDRARWASFGFKYDDVIGGFKIVVNPMFLHGFDTVQSKVPFGAFDVVTVNGVANRDLTETLSAELNVSGQYALNRLPAPLLGFYGGTPIGRAFDPGALAGNTIVSGALQVAQKIDTRVPWAPSLNLIGFIDAGAAWNRTASPYQYAWLSSAGVGLSVPLGEWLTATAFVAQPLRHDEQLSALGVHQSTRLRFSVALRF